KSYSPFPAQIHYFPKAKWREKKIVLVQTMDLRTDVPSSQHRARCCHLREAFRVVTLVLSPASAGANSGPPRQGGTAALPSSVVPPDYAGSIPTSGPRQIPARSPS